MRSTYWSQDSDLNLYRVNIIWKVRNFGEGLRGLMSWAREREMVLWRWCGWIYREEKKYVEDERRVWKEGREFEILNFLNFCKGRENRRHRIRQMRRKKIVSKIFLHTINFSWLLCSIHRLSNVIIISRLTDING